METLRRFPFNGAASAPAHSNEGRRRDLNQNRGQPEVEQGVECRQTQQTEIPALLRGIEKARNHQNREQSRTRLPEALGQNDVQRLFGVDHHASSSKASCESKGLDEAKDHLQPRFNPY